jgi:hypothetical protein
MKADRKISQDAKLNRVVDTSPVERHCEPQEIANGVVFLSGKWNQEQKYC